MGVCSELSDLAGYLAFCGVGIIYCLCYVFRLFGVGVTCLVTAGGLLILVGWFRGCWWVW